MKTILELKDERTILIDRNNALISLGKKEYRKLTDVEQTEFDANLTKIETLGAEIRTAENPAAAELRTVNPSVQVVPKMKIRTPLLRAITNKLESRTNEPEIQAILDQGRAEFRKAGVNYTGDILLPMGEAVEQRADIVAGVATAGQEIVSEDKLSILGPLRANLVLVKAGARFVSGLIGNVSIPTYAGSTAAWKGEVVTSDDGAGAFDEVDLSPKRLTCHIDVSKLFLIQDAVDAEALLKNDIVSAIVVKLESTIFGDHVHAAEMPDGFFTGYDGSLTTLDGSVDWAKMVGHETAVETANALVDNLAFITNPAARGVLKTTAKGTVSDDIMLMGADNQVNGYPVLVTSGVASLSAPAAEEGIVFGNWADFVIGQWGAVDLIVDPFTVAKEGKVRIVVNAYFDAKMRRAASFSVASLKA